MAQPRLGDLTPVVAAWLRLPQPELGQAITLLRRTCREAGRDLPREALAARLVALSDHGAAVDGTAIWRWETARVGASPGYRQLLGRVCEAELARLSDTTRREFVQQLGILAGWPLLGAHTPAPAVSTPAPPLAGWPATEPADQEYVGAMHAAVQHLVGLDNAFGGNEIAALATRTFRRAQSHLAAGLYVPAVERDLQAGAAELAEVAGWLLHDASDEDSSRRLSQEALLLARLAGDRSMEHLTLANMSLQAIFQRRPGEALQIARAELAAGPLPPRLQVIFGIREARALAQLGDEDATRRALDTATSAFQEGPSRLDPAWAWWVDASEFALHRGLALVDLGDLAGALPLLQQAIEGCPPHRRNARFIYVAQFLRALIDAGAWQDVETVIREATNLAGEVGSARTLGLLRDAVSLLTLAPAPAAVREAAERMTSAD
jgi:tetratricopeptide (TPR) repeat protein